ncbi:MAG TPA: hypothetical protein VFC63_19895 [Blastocatellia bacterium]|nr:hypothetical protein [Blastocatellia bacterium]
MRLLNRTSAFVVITFTIIASMVPVISDASHHKNKAKKATSESSAAAIWRRPSNMARRDLYYGPGGPEHRPQGPFKFVKEDPEGTNPKFDVVDANGVTWRIKLGQEARPETAVTRLLWAAGYFVNEDYYLPTIVVEGMPKLKRGNHYVSAHGVVRGARLKRKISGEKEVGDWNWFDNPFVGTREFNGLKVMMALINNWDLKEVNNHIYKEPNGEVRYVVADLGASFGKTGNSLTRSKDDLKGYERTKFINKTKEGEVNFVMHSRPFFLFALDIPNYTMRARMEKVVKDIPATDARWLGRLLAELSRNQIEDAFRAAGYSPMEVARYTDQIEIRIHELNTLPVRY